MQEGGTLLYGMRIRPERGRFWKLCSYNDIPLKVVLVGEVGRNKFMCIEDMRERGS